MRLWLERWTHYPLGTKITGTEPVWFGSLGLLGLLKFLRIYSKHFCCANSGFWECHSYYQKLYQTFSNLELTISAKIKYCNKIVEAFPCCYIGLLALFTGRYFARHYINNKKNKRYTIIIYQNYNGDIEFWH